MTKWLLLFLLFIPLLLLGQPKQGQPKLDSLLAELNAPKNQAAEDTGKVKLLVDISTCYMYINTDLGIKFGNEALLLAKKIAWEKGQALANNYIGQNYFIKSDIDKALVYDFEALSINQKIDNKDGIAKNFGNIGNAYMMQNNNPLALDYFKKGLKLNEELGNKKSLAIAYGNVGIVYHNQSNYAGALQYYFKALKINEEFGDKAIIATNLVNIGLIYKNQASYERSLEYYFKALSLYQSVANKNGISATYSNIGTVYKLQDNLDTALNYYTLALSYAEQAGVKKFITINIGNLGDVMTKQKRFREAMAQFEKALKLNVEYGFKSGQANNYASIGECYLEMAKAPSASGSSRSACLARAIDNENKAITIFQEIGELKDLQSANSLLSEAYALSGNYKAAMEAYQKAEFIKDSIAAKSTKIQVANLETQRDLDLKQKDIQLELLRKANKSKTSIIYISGIVLLLIVLGFGLNRFMRQTRSHRQLSQEKTQHLQHIKAQGEVLKDIAFVQSHHVRGPMTTIMGLAELFNLNDPNDPTNKELMEGIITTAHHLDKVITNVVAKENALKQ